MGELKPDVDLQALNEWFADIPPGPYDALNTMGGWEVRQIDTDPTNKHNWPFRLCSSISGQTAECDAAVFNFIAGVINAWPQILDAARTEGRGEGEPVASDKALFDALWELVAAMANEGIPQTPRTKAAFKVAHQAALDRLRKDWSSPIREPEISREAVDIEKVLRQATIDYNKGAAAPGVGIHEFSAQRVSAILNLAPVGGRGEEGSSQSQPVLSPKSDTEGPSADGWVSVEDRFPGEQGFDSGNVLVFINGHCDLLDMTCRQGGAWGIQLGWFDVERQAFRVGGTVERQVTHWCDLPNPPERRAVDDGEADHTGQLRDEPSSSNINEESQTNGS